MFGPVDDFFEAAFERQQAAGAADRALGEDANHVAFVEFVARALERPDDLAAVGRRYRDRAHQAKKPIERFEIVIFAVQHETDKARQRRADQDRIDEGDVIGHQERRALQR